MNAQTIWLLAALVALGMLPYLIFRWRYRRQVHAQFFITTTCFMTSLLIMFYISGIIASILSIVGFFIRFWR